MANGGHGVEAARTAGHKGSAKSLAVAASRHLGSSAGQKLLNANVAKLEKRIKLDELFDRLSTMARLPDTELVDMKDFITLMSVAPVEAKATPPATGEAPPPPRGRAPSQASS